MKTLLFVENMILYLENLKECTDKLLEWINLARSLETVYKNQLYFYMSAPILEKRKIWKMSCIIALRKLHITVSITV